MLIVILDELCDSNKGMEKMEVHFGVITQETAVQLQLS